MTFTDFSGRNPGFDPTSYGLDQYDLFVSYCRRNVEFVRRLHRALAVQHQTVWVDWNDIPPTANWWAEIQRGIDRADNFLFVLTPESLASKVCLEELNHAIHGGKRLIPIVRTDVTGQIPESIAKLNWIFFRDGDDFDTALERLLVALRSDLDYVRMHTRLLNRATEWRSGDRDGSFLLRGKQLQSAVLWLDHPMLPYPTQSHQEYIQASLGEDQIRQEAERRSHFGAKNRDRLLNLVTQAWIKGVLYSDLTQHTVPIQVSLATSPQAITPTWSIAPPQSGPKLLQIFLGEFFEQEGPGRTLLILGTPGSGKTTQLLLLAEQWINRARQQRDCPMPVVLHLSSWRGQALADWLVEELSSKYQVPRQTGYDWVRNQELLLFLDGLDEVPLSDRSACVTMINAFQQANPSEMVVCCRLKDYYDLQITLNFQAAVTLQPLSSAQINSYLASSDQNLTGLQALIRQDPAFAELAQSPLTLNLMALAYQSLGPSTLLHPDTAQRKQGLFEAYVDRAFKRRGDTERTKARSIDRLIWLAKRLTDTGQTEFLIEQMQPSWLQSAKLKWRYRFILRLLIGGVSGVAVGLLSGVLNNNPQSSFPGFIPGLSPGVMAGVTAGLFEGGLSGLLAGLLAGLLPTIKSPRWLGIWGGILFTLLGSLWQSIPNLSPWLDFDAHPLKLLDGMLFALVFGIVMGQLQQGTIEPVDTVKWSWVKFRQTAQVGGAYGFIGGVLILLLKQLSDSFRFDRILCQDRNEVWLNALLDYQFCSDLQLSALDRGLGLIALALFVGLTVGLILGFQRVSEVERRTRPNQGIWKSFYNGVRLMVIGGPLSFFLSWATWKVYAATPATFWWVHYGDTNHPLDGLAFGWVVSLMVGLSTGLVGGEGSGLVCLQHLILRFILWQSGKTPWNYARFLDRMSDRILLKKVGGGYIFMHRLLLDHLAKKTDHPSSRPLGKS
jgi:eukaryotic-like serine/threonine-protein kinase